jgi:hypothetical protein
VAGRRERLDCPLCGERVVRLCRIAAEPANNDSRSLRSFVLRKAPHLRLALGAELVGPQGESWDAYNAINGPIFPRWERPMKPPAFFLSSTIYDFKDLRSAIKYYL